MHQDQIIEGTLIPAKTELCDQWGFGPMGIWSHPFYAEIAIPDPIPPGCFIDSYWYGKKVLRSQFFNTREEAEVWISKWTLARRVRWLSEPPINWVAVTQSLEYRGFLTTKGLRKYRKIHARDGYPFPALDAVESDYKHGITFTHVHAIGVCRRCIDNIARNEISPDLQAAIDLMAVSPLPVRRVFKWVQESAAHLRKEIYGK